jgi:hypothetical protein
MYEVFVYIQTVFSVLPALMLVLILNTIVDGMNDAILYSRKGAHAFPWNEHIILVLDRAGLPLVSVFTILTSDLAWTMVQLWAYLLMHSFIHNGAYYLCRDKIDGTNHGFKHQSPTTTAKVDLNYKQRSILFVIGLLLLVAYWMF